MDNEELNLDQIESQSEEKLKVKNRFQQLSDKVALTSKERDEFQALAKANAEAKALAEKERDFYKDFSANVTKYPSASEYQAKILEKVKAGYSTEDAMVAVLAKEGKLSSPVQQPNTQVAGGSATNTTEGPKTLQDMTPAEKLAALAEADNAGQLANALRGR